MHQMENDKSPGIDGIPIEFYEIFYEFLEQDLLQLYNKKIYQNNKPSHYYFNSKKRESKQTQILETNLTFMSRL